MNTNPKNRAPFAPLFPMMALALIASAPAAVLVHAPATASAESVSDGEARYWSEIAAHPGLVCVVAEDGETYAAIDGGDPKPKTSVRETGECGDVFALYGLDGAITVTCNLWSRQPVPAAYRHLFTATHRKMRRVGGVGLDGLREAREIVAKGSEAGR